MSTAVDTRPHTWSLRRWALSGFIIGVAITVPATFFALLAPTGEILHPYLVPATELLRPVAHAMATWPGLVNMAIAALVNGALYAVGSGALGAFLSVLRRR